MSKINDPLTVLVLAVFRANGTMVQWGDHFAVPFGLTSARWQVLGALALSDQPLSAPRIAESMGVTRQGAQKQLNLLLDEGLIERLPNPSNMRSPLYRLSAAGQRRYREVEASWKKHTRSLRQHLIDPEIDVANKVLTRLISLHTQTSDGEDQ